MAEGDRLRRLQMGEARHDHAPRCRARGSASARCNSSDLPKERVDRVAHPEAEIDRDLVVARARGVQAPGRRADDLGEPAFDIHMDVLERALERERPRLDFAFDLGKTAGDRLGVGGFDDARAASMAIWAFDPAMSWAASLRSKSIEALISSIASAGRPLNRPPHIVLLMRVVPDEWT